MIPQLPCINEHSIVNLGGNLYKAALLGWDHSGIASVSGMLELADKDLQQTSSNPVKGNFMAFEGMLIMYS